MTNELIDEMLIHTRELKLKDKEEVIRKAAEICRIYMNKCPEREIKRTILLSSCLYISAMVHKERVTQASLAKAFEISESTLNKRYKEIVRAIRIINPKILG